MNRSVFTVLAVTIVLLAPCSSSLAQHPMYNGLYVNESNEFICFNADSVSFNIENEVGLITSNVGIGTVKYRSKKIKINLIPIENFVVQLDSTESQGKRI